MNKMRIMTSTKFEKGQALAETIITAAVLGSVLLASATLYQLMQADLTANKAARLAVWQGVLYTGLSKEDMESRFEETLRKTLMKRDIKDLIHQSAAPLVGEVDDIYYKYDQVDPTYTYPSNRSSAIANRAGLNDNTISGITLSIPLNSDAEIFKLSKPKNVTLNSTTDMTPGYDPLADTYRYHLTAKAALLSNGFVPKNEAEFTSAVSDISGDGAPLTFFETWRNSLNFFGFKEIKPAIGDAGVSTVAQDQSRILPAQLGTFSN